ncbi:D-sedoheptulose 7-phosphate isomerase [Metapseudomonas otitidis]|jgi:D-sedoheptulose 7-phosphate isomerase|uniref:Phosphoheptose isomerase n=2 Tax=Metapseudomonas otitidis TaxID=319939 RepID=A0A1I0U492_9GAMM|nr:MULTISPECIES: D-sedoheptulose 7-phosphate isomerase [Pseudomonas]KIV62868.1 Phosphoheptose isomerase [Pseudomonas sp. FeS53a]MCO7553914.1 D-sedoheptulose 7-phosphate isomerase [Pseudomonas otitidis]MCP1620914.1 D-sedoheptulose 7-phosphate isomerase [Pseudomonas otitidis]MDG9780755.1 D-sedoheptulose 7-phosphate isomerase [Pseudomonas otitidis]MDH0336438.1 D-sedoheptulose 7-phosphate isomerase [Pseudomonas otitidis]
MLSHIRNSLEEARRALDAFIDNEATLRNIERAADLLVASFENKGKAFSCGNGGSMCDAMHFAEELTGRYRKNRPGIAAISISDASHISCVANDFGYDHIFSRYIESHGREGDVLLAFSTSGRSPNVIKAAEAAKALGVKVIALTGKPGSQLEALADVCVCAPGGDFADRVQELHIKVVHILIELVERKLAPQNYA